MYSFKYYIIELTQYRLEIPQCNMTYERDVTCNIELSDVVHCVRVNDAWNVFVSVKATPSFEVSKFFSHFYFLMCSATSTVKSILLLKAFFWAILL